MKAIVDPDICTGCGLCADICPEVFEMKGSVAVAKTADISKELEDSCRDAAESCPVEAITVE